MVVRYIVTRVVVILESDKSCLSARAVEPSRINCLKVEVVRPPKGKSLSRIKATREGHRTTVKRIAYAVNEELNTSNSDFNLNENKQTLAQNVSKLRQQKETLRFKLEALKVLYEEIL